MTKQTNKQKTQKTKSQTLTKCLFFFGSLCTERHRNVPLLGNLISFVWRPKQVNSQLNRPDSSFLDGCRLSWTSCVTRYYCIKTFLTLFLRSSKFFWLEGILLQYTWTSYLGIASITHHEAKLHTSPNWNNRRNEQRGDAHKLHQKDEGRRIT